MRLPTTAVLVSAALTLGVTAGPAQAGHGDRDDLPPGRDLRSHVVRPGETATGLAVRYHAWTAELIAHNHLGPAGALRVGQQLQIPVVRSAVPRRDVRDGRGPGRAGRPERPGQTAPDASREAVRDTIVRVARRTGVDPQLALAVSWQESGWQMHHVSGAGAIGAMQVLPSTARWMEWYVGRSLRPRRLLDNVVTGVTLLRVLRESTRSQHRRLGAYYQGLGAVREHGLYDETRHYVANIRAIRDRLERGQPPA